MTEKPFCWLLGVNAFTKEESVMLDAKQDGHVIEPLFGSAQLTAAREEAREKALEEAKKIVRGACDMCMGDGQGDTVLDTDDGGNDIYCECKLCGPFVRALKAKEGE